MYTGVGSELRVFFLCAFAGIACAFLYDIFKMIRLACKVGVRVTFLMDILYWVLTALLAFYMLLYTNYGQFRLFEAVAMLVGVLLYFLSVSAAVVKSGTAVLRCLFRGAFFVGKIVIFPFRAVYRRILAPLCRKITKKFKKIDKNRLTTRTFWFKIIKGMVFFGKHSSGIRKRRNSHGVQK